MRPARRRVRALVLCAGRGERLRPLTVGVPKPLLPVAGRTAAVRTIEALHRVGAETAVNLHYLAGTVRTGLEQQARARGIELTFAEEPQLLGTLGALVNLRDFLAGGDDVVLVNGDSVCRWPLADALARHRRSGADVTLQLGPREPPERLGGGVEVDGRGIVIGLRDLQVGDVRGRRRTFQGLHVLSPRVVESLPDQALPGDIVAGLYQPLLRDGARIVGFACRRRWHDLGTPRRYLAGALDWGRTAGGRGRRRRFIAPGVAVESSATVERSVVESGCRLGAGARVEGSLLLPGVRIGEGALIRGALIAPGIQVAPGSRVSGQMVTPPGWGVDTAAGSRERGGLVCTDLRAG